MLDGESGVVLKRRSEVGRRIVIGQPSAAGLFCGNRVIRRRGAFPPRRNGRQRDAAEFFVESLSKINCYQIKYARRVNGPLAGAPL